jgi:hypothetical protein
MNYKYPLYAPYWKVDLFHKAWYNTLSSLFQMINVKDHEDGSFTIEWDENDPEESIFNDWTKEDFINFFRYCVERENAKKSGEESQEAYYIKATNEETFGIEGDELTED